MLLNRGLSSHPTQVQPQPPDPAEAVAPQPRWGYLLLAVQWWCICYNTKAVVWLAFPSFVIPEGFGRTLFCLAWYFKTRPGMSQCYFTSLLFHIGFTCTYSKNTNSIYFHPHLSLPFSTKPFLPPSFYDCSHVTTSLCCHCISVRDCRLVPHLKHTSMPKRNSLSILIRDNESRLTQKAWAFPSFFHLSHKKSPQAIQLKLIHFRQSDHTAKVLSLSDAISRTERLN